MTVKAMAKIRQSLCKEYFYNCTGCPLSNLRSCNDLMCIAEWITPEREKELIDWYNKNATTYLNDFCKKFPKVDRKYVVDDICCGEVYNGCICRDSEKGDCAEHWNRLMENE